MSDAKNGLWRLLIAAIGANAIAYLGWYTLPSQWVTLSGPLGLSQSATSLVVTAEVLTAAVVSIVVSFVIGARAPRTLLALGVALTLTGHAYALFATGFTELCASRLIAGIGEGLLWVMLNAAIAGMNEPDRRFGQVNAVTSLILAAVVAGIPYASGLDTERPVYLVLVALTIVLVPTLLPFALRAQRPRGAERPALGSVRAWLLVFAVAIWSMSATVTYVLAAVIGERTHAGEAAVHFSIALSLIGIILGAGLAGMIGVRFGRTNTLLALLALESAAAFVFVFAPGLAGFTAGLMVVNFCVYCALPYMLGLGADLDRSGGAAAAAAGAFVLGGGLSPMFGAYIVANFGGSASIPWAIVATSLIAVAVFVGLERTPAPASANA